MEDTVSRYWANVRRRTTRRRLLTSGAAAGAGAASLALVGCGDDDDDDDDDGAATATTAPGTGTAGPSGEARPGGSVVIAASSPPHLDPTLNASFATVAMHRNIYNRLFRTVSGPGEDPGSLRMIPDLAEALPEQPDETTYIIKVRQDVTFHNMPPVNGRQLTGEDVVYTFQRLLDPNVASPNRSLYTRINNIELMDPYTVRITTDEPYSPLIVYLGHYYSGWIIPREAVEQFGDLRGNAIGTGPFTLESFSPNQEAVFAKNPNFFQKPYPYIDRLQYLFIDQAQPRIAALEAGNIDVGTFPAQDLERLEGLLTDDGGGVIRTLPGLASSVIMMTKRAPLDDERVRRALSLLLDQQLMIDVTLFGEGVFAGLGMPPLYSEWSLSQDELRELHPYDPEQAQALLEEAGMGNGFDTNLYFSPFYSAAGVPVEDFVEIYVESLRQAGINAEVEAKEYQAHLQTWTTENFSLYLGPRTIGLTPDEFYAAGFTPGGARNFSKLDDPEITRMSEQIQRTFDVDEQIDLSHQLMRRLGELAPEAPLPSPYAFTGYRGRLKDFSVSADFGSPTYQWTWVDE
ncbi:MAG TPA: ABC transporter substrate-binding protein [Dehalococcoidia bacterium]|nr:ABC transporter substrate-binding protein [Dehalococcoidia bacterium]